MSFEIYKRLSGGFVKNGFDIISQNRKISEKYSKYCAFYKNAGTIDLIAAVMRKDTLGEDIYQVSDAIFERIKKISRNEKIVFIAVYICSGNDEQLFEFCDVPAFYPNEKYVYMKWIIDAENRNFIVNGQQPKKMFSVEKIIKKALSVSEDTPETFSDISAKKYQNILKTKIPLFTYIVIGIYFAVFIAAEISGGSKNIQTIIKFGGITGEKIYSGEFYRLFTAMFVHIGFMHLFSNSFSLYVMGSRAERYMGSVFFVLCYIFSGLCSSLGALYFSPESVTAGGSGAIFGIEGAAAVYTALKKVNMDGLNYYTSLIFVIFGLSIGFLIPNISNIGHICGLAGGIIFTFAYLKLTEGRKSNPSP